MPRSQPSTFTNLLRAWHDGDEEAGNTLVMLAWRDLHRLARLHLRREPNAASLQPTALINEVFVRFSDEKEIEFENRAHFFAVAALMMRRVLIDRARSAQAGKRPPVNARLPLEDALHATLWEQDLDLVALGEALSQLTELFPRAAQVVDLHFFAGFTEHETAELLGISRATLQRDWEFARLWLYDQLGGATFRRDGKAVSTESTAGHEADLAQD